MINTIEPNYTDQLFENPQVVTYTLVAPCGLSYQALSIHQLGA